MKPGWEVKALGEVCRLINGRAYKQAELLDEGKYRVLRVGNFFTSNHWYFSDLEMEPDKYCEDGDLLYAWSASFGPRIWRGEKTVYHYHIWKVAADPALVIRDYLYYFFDWDKEKIKADQGAGTTMVHVSKKSMDAREIPFPPLDEQKRIVEVLDAAFEGLSRARAHTETNLQNARELFEKIGGALLSECAEGAQMVPLEQVAKLTRGQNPPKSVFISEPREGYVRFYQIRDGKTDDYAVYVPESKKLHLVSPDEILMTAYRHVGDVFRNANGAFNVALCKISNRDTSKMLNDYLYAIIPTDMVKGELLKRSERSLIPSMSVEHLKEIRIPLPSVAQQKLFMDRLTIAQQDAQILQSHYRAKLTDLDALRQALLQKAFAGELS